MADGSVTERRLRPIHDAVASNNWKQALKECEKWQKKGEKSDKFHALKAYVLVNQPDQAQIDKGQSETLQLCARNPAITDFDTINILQDALRDLSLEAQEGPKLWERAATAKPGDKAILMTWLNRALEDSQWQFAQKAAMALRNAFPNERNYDFWNILLCFLVEQDERASEKERTLFGTLAYRLISKAAESIPTTTDGVANPGKSVAKPEEISLLVRVYLATSHCKEAVDLLTGPTLSLRSSAGLQDPQLMMTLLIQCLSGLPDNETMLKICRIILGYPHGPTDDRLWSALRHIYQTGDDKVKAQVTKLMDDNLSQDEIRHRSFLARQNTTGSDPAQANLTFCKDAFSRAGSKPHIFKDLRDNIEALDEHQIQEFLSSIDASSQFSQVFALKVSKLSLSAKPADLLSHASKALIIYTTSLASDTPSPETSILAALSLVQLSLSTGSRTPLLRAAIILKLSHAKHEDYFPITVFLLSLYRYLGLVSLAFAAYGSLSIKNLQMETVSHVVLTRIGTLHPHLPKDEVSELGKAQLPFEPAGVLENTLQVGRKVIHGVGESIKRGLREGSYSNVINAAETRKTIECSLWQRICAVEEQKVARMTGDSTLEPWQAHAESKDEQTLWDQRDTAFMPQYSDADTAVWAELGCGPVPKEGWLHIMILQQRLLNYLRSKADKGLAEREWEALKTAQKQAQVSLPNASAVEAQLTGPETGACNAMKLIIDLIEAVKSSDAPPDEIITTLVKTLGEWIKSSSPDDRPDEVGVGWRQLHHWYVGLELTYLVSALASWVANPGPAAAASGSKGKKGKGPADAAPKPASSLPKEKIDELRHSAEQLQGEIHEQAKSLKARFAEGGVLGRVLEQVMPPPSGEEVEASEKEFNEAFGAFVQSLGGEAAVETAVGLWLASWEDACDGVLGVRSAPAVSVSGGGGGKGK